MGGGEASNMAVTLKQSSEIITYFSKTCPNAPTINRATAKWTARDLVESYGVETCHKVIDWYAKVQRSPEWKHFVRTFELCLSEMTIYQRDIEVRRKNRAIANEWRKS